MVDNVRGWREGNGKRGKRTNARTWLLEIGESGREQWALVIIEERRKKRKKNEEPLTDNANRPLSHLFP